MQDDRYFYFGLDVFQKYDYLFGKGNSDCVNANTDLPDDNWGQPAFMENDYSIEEILDMPTECEVQMKMTNINCVGQDELCKSELDMSVIG